MTTTSHRTRTLFGLSAILFAVGCGADDASSDEHDLYAQASSYEPSIDAGLADPSVDGGADDETDGRVEAGGSPPRSPFLVDVRATGTGCPAGTWQKVISADGRDFALRFSAFALEVGEGTRRLSKECTIIVSVAGPDSLSYALGELDYEGYARLERGVTGFHTTNSYFQGSAMDVDKEKRSDVHGPFDDSITLDNAVHARDLVWSPCGLRRSLRIATRIGIEKPGDEGAGHVSLREVRGPKLIWRRCR